MQDPAPPIIPPADSAAALGSDLVLRNAAVLVGGLVLLAILFLVLGFVVRRLFRAAESLDALKALRPLLAGLRKNIRGLLALGFLASSLGFAGYGGWLWYQGEDLLDWGRARLAEMPDGFWVDLGIGAGKVLGLVIAAFLVLRPLTRLLGSLTTKAKDVDGIRANDESVEALGNSATTLVKRAVWLSVLVLSATWLGTPEWIQSGTGVLLRVFVILSIGMLAWRTVTVVVDSLDGLSRKHASPDNWLRYYDRLRHLVPLFRRCLEYAIFVFAASLALQQIESLASFAVHGETVIQLIGIVFIARVVVELMRLLTEEFLVKRPKLAEEELNRRKTLVPLIQSLLTYAIYFGAGVAMLGVLDQPVAPILASAGILGLAVGLAAQDLIKDMLSGFFILFEGYFIVGDFIGIEDVEGTVEKVDLRTTRIRDNDGRHHIIRNGNIENIVNYSMAYTYSAVHVGVAYESDLKAVHDAIEEAGRRLAEQDQNVLEPTVVKGLHDFGESELTYRTLTKVKPGKHLQTGRDLRRLIKDVFDEREIEIPYARRVLIVKNEDGEPASSDELVAD